MGLVVYLFIPTVWFLIEVFSAFNFKVIIVEYASITIFKHYFEIVFCGSYLFLSSFHLLCWDLMTLFSTMLGFLYSVCVCVCVCMYLLSIFGWWLPWSFYIAIYDYFKMMSSSLQMHCNNLPFYPPYLIFYLIFYSFLVCGFLNYLLWI